MKDCRSRIAEMHRAENVQWGLRSGVGYALLRGGLPVHSSGVYVRAVQVQEANSGPFFTYLLRTRPDEITTCVRDQTLEQLICSQHQSNVTSPRI
jgi:hypothetical protein